MIRALKMAGPLRNGAERGKGSVFHAVEVPEGREYAGDGGRALCGRAPAIMWSTEEGDGVTCPRCLGKLEERRDQAI